VAIARSLMNDPSVLFADEPDGEFGFENGCFNRGIVTCPHEGEAPNFSGCYPRPGSCAARRTWRAGNQERKNCGNDVCKTVRINEALTNLPPLTNEDLHRRNVLSRRDAKVSVFDHGLLYGDGIFEGDSVLTTGVCFQLTEQLQRAGPFAKAIALKIPLTIAEMEEATLETITPEQLARRLYPAFGNAW